MLWPMAAGVVVMPVLTPRSRDLAYVGYQPADWPDDYVAWALPRLLATVPSRLRRGADACAFVAWLSGRAPMPATIQLEPW
jgi:maleylpyruvate isomerase